MLTYRCELDPARPEPAEEEATRAMAGWDLPSGMVRLWVRQAAERAGSERLQLQLEYDAELGLVSCEAWGGGRRVFGIDDWVGQR